MSFDTPILILTHKRFNSVKLIVNELKKIKPKQIYLANNPLPIEATQEEIKNQKKIIKLFDNLPWDYILKKKIHPEHLDVKNSIVQSINWFFSNVEYGIILEDDCIPCPSFFYFCQTILIKYLDNQKIMHICGSNFQKIHNHKFSYYFSKYNHVWGWASWKRAWNLYDKDITFWPKLKKSDKWIKINPLWLERRYWDYFFSLCFNNKIITWDYQWLACIWNYNGISIIPNKNLITNVGFDKYATNTKKNKSVFCNKRMEFKSIKHPQKIDINNEADIYTFYSHYLGVSTLNLTSICIIIFKIMKRLITR